MKQPTKKMTRREALQLAVSYKQDLENKITENHALRLNLQFSEEFLRNELGQEKLDGFKQYLSQRMLETVASGSVAGSIGTELAETAANGADMSGSGIDADMFASDDSDCDAQGQMKH
ncbi:hypothetical protein pD_gene0058 [Vibrio phage 033B]|nr:hypothetical protein pD_gene0058 [Vibrio phage 033B]